MSGTQGRGGRKQAAGPEREKTDGAGRKPDPGKNTGAGKAAKSGGAGKGAPAAEAAQSGTTDKASRATEDPAAGRAASDAAGTAAGEKGPRPPRVTVAAVLTAVEGIVIAALGGYELVLGIVGEPDSTRQAVFGGLTVLALAVLPLAAALGLWRQRRWSRGPSMITQILALPVAFAMVSTGGTMLALGLVLGVVAVGALVCVLSPSTAEALGVGPSRTA
ncbi:hypothetical protein DMB38_24710 [Streptomyces sp. WAC 06738]|uniref:hypothetical protein n=1 Tax=Streptomyces sp. WAC 06738 TaxID=2203210 RepID=UPI000F715358|nr:hypothetical protein [Streptomyces sp. WAC 06738]AZM48559.1 hypothetical protein DMB38_24710 [Streptomyces sp. WAC 06738]